MYFWKCWRDSRARFICLAVLAVVAGWLCAWGLSYELHDRAISNAMKPEMLGRVWERAMQFAVAIGGLMMVVVGGALGASGVGEEFERGSALFLLTRPRQRRYFVWVSNTLGALQVAAFACLFTLTIFAVLLYYRPVFANPEWVAVIPVFCVTGLLTHGLAQLITVGARNTKNAFAGAVILLFMYGIFTLVARKSWQVDLPSPSDMYSQILAPNKEVSLALMLFGWLAVALMFPVIQQLLVERMEP